MSRLQAVGYEVRASACTDRPAHVENSNGTYKDPGRCSMRLVHASDSLPSPRFPTYVLPAPADPCLYALQGCQTRRREHCERRTESERRSGRFAEQDAVSVKWQRVRNRVQSGLFRRAHAGVASAAARRGQMQHGKGTISAGCDSPAPCLNGRVAAGMATVAGARTFCCAGGVAHESRVRARSNEDAGIHLRRSDSMLRDHARLTWQG
jgi:hypothetical protein